MSKQQDLEKIFSALIYCSLSAAILAFVFCFFIDCGGMITTDLDPNKSLLHNDADDYSFGAKYFFSFFLLFGLLQFLFLSKGFLGISQYAYEKYHMLFIQIILGFLFILIAIVSSPKLIEMSFWGGFILIGIVAYIISSFRST